MTSLIAMQQVMHRMAPHPQHFEMQSCALKAAEQLSIVEGHRINASQQGSCPCAA